MTIDLLEPATSIPYGAGSPFKPDGINNPFSPYGSPFSNQSATNPFATDAPRLLVRLSGFSGLSGSSGWFSGPANKIDQIDQFRLSLRRRGFFIFIDLPSLLTHGLPLQIF